MPVKEPKINICISIIHKDIYEQIQKFDLLPKSTFTLRDHTFQVVKGKKKTKTRSTKRQYHFEYQLTTEKVLCITHFDYTTQQILAGNK